MNPHRQMAAAMHALIDVRATDPNNLPWCSRCRVDFDLDTGRCECDDLAFGMEVVNSIEDDYQPKPAYHPPLPAWWEPARGAVTPRLVAAGFRRGYPLGTTRICWGCHSPVHPVTLACDCYTPAHKTRTA